MSKLKIAIQKSGRLNQDSLKLLKDCGNNTDLFDYLWDKGVPVEFYIAYEKTT